MAKTRAIILGLLLLAVLLALTSSGWAVWQESSPFVGQGGAAGFTTPDVSGAGALSLVTPMSDGRVAEALRGNGAAGPYLLAYHHLTPAGEVVTVNGMPATRGADYTLDYATGKLTFTRPLSAADLARVEYWRQPGLSGPNQRSVALPLSFSLGNMLGNDLELTYLYRADVKPAQTGSRSATASEYGVLGLGSSGKLGSQGNITAALLVSDQPKKATAGASGDATAWRLAADQTFGGLKLSARMTRAGSQFADAKGYGLKRGAETMDMAADYRASNALSLRSTFAREHDLTSPSGAAVSTWGQGLSFNERGLPKLELSRMARVISRPGQGEVTTVTDRLALEHRVNPDTLFGYRREQVREDTSEATTSVLSLNTKLSNGMTAGASRELRTSDQGLVSDNTRVDLAAAPAPWLKLRAGEAWGKTSADERRSFNTGLELSPWSWWSLAAVRGHESTDSYVRELIDLRTSLKPVSYLALNAGYTGRADRTGAATLDTTQAAVTFSPLKHLQIAGEHAVNPLDPAGKPQPATASKVAVSTQVGSLGLKSAYGRRMTLAGDDYRDSELDLSLRVNRFTNLYSGYRLSESQRPQVVADNSRYRLGVSHNVGSDFSLALEAQMMFYRENQLLLRDRTETRAEAKLNARF